VKQNRLGFSSFVIETLYHQGKQLTPFLDGLKGEKLYRIRLSCQGKAAPQLNDDELYMLATGLGCDEAELKHIAEESAAIWFTKQKRKPKKKRGTRYGYIGSNKIALEDKNIPFAVRRIWTLIGKKYGGGTVQTKEVLRSKKKLYKRSIMKARTRQFAGDAPEIRLLEALCRSAVMFYKGDEIDDSEGDEVDDN